MMNIVAKTASAWRREPTIFPYMNTSAPGMISTSSISKKFVKPVGFSNGCAEFELKKPPPLVPSSLIASCEATGPIAIVCAMPLMPCTET